MNKVTFVSGDTTLAEIDCSDPCIMDEFPRASAMYLDSNNTLKPFPYSFDADGNMSVSTVTHTDSIVLAEPTRTYGTPVYSKWRCRLFGSEASNGIVYTPLEGKVPNRFVRWMMKVCFDCKLVKDE